MLYKYLVFTLTLLWIFPVFSAIKYCNETFNIKNVCKLGEYNPGMPDTPWPAKIDVWVEILEIVDFDWNSGTISIFIKFWSLWNDTRVTIVNKNDG